MKPWEDVNFAEAAVSEVVPVVRTANTNIPTSETDACIADPPRMAAAQPAPPANTNTNRAMESACTVVLPPTAAALPVPPVSMNTKDGGRARRAV